VIELPMENLTVVSKAAESPPGQGGYQRQIHKR
jgi:hypothetical protein